MVKMKHVTIPQTSLTVSQICIGSTDFGSTIPAEDVFRLLDAFVSAGGNFVDTAHVYANWRAVPTSISEKTIGLWLRENGLREQIIVGTKGAHPDLSTMSVPRLSRADIVRDLDESLDHLKTDYVDVYWLHRDDTERPICDIIETLNEQVMLGKIRYFGCSNWRISRIQEAHDYAAERNMQGFAANQPMWSFAVPNMEAQPDKTLVAMDDEGLAFHRETGMAAIPYSSQAKGYFSKLEAASVEQLPDSVREVYHSTENVKRFERARQLARKYKVAMNDIALGYLIAQPFTTIPIVGCRNLEQLQSSVKALDLTLTPDDVAYLEGA
jgi:aryl-alcohol dehydrogenase-like predicted oxidoreductase